MAGDTKTHERLIRIETMLEANNTMTSAGFGNVNTRLDQLNGKVAAHEKRHNEQDVTNAQVLGSLGTLLSERNDHAREVQGYRKFFIERLIYLAVTVIAVYFGIMQ